MSYNPLITVNTKPVNIIIRLNVKDTIYLRKMILEAGIKNTGLSAVFLSWAGAHSLTESPEQGRQVKAIGFHKGGSGIQGDLTGYGGPWSHIELAYPEDTIEDMAKLINAIKGSYV